MGIRANAVRGMVHGASWPRLRDDSVATEPGWIGPSFFRRRAPFGARAQARERRRASATVRRDDRVRGLRQRHGLPKSDD